MPEVTRLDPHLAETVDRIRALFDQNPHAVGSARDFAIWLGSQDHREHVGETLAVLADRKLVKCLGGKNGDSVYRLASVS